MVNLKGALLYVKEIGFLVHCYDNDNIPPISQISISTLIFHKAVWNDLKTKNCKFKLLEISGFFSFEDWKFKNLNFYF